MVRPGGGRRSLSVIRYSALRQLPQRSTKPRYKHVGKADDCRVRQACFFCRLHKRKCSGGLPCELCRRRGRSEQCCYTDAPSVAAAAEDIAKFAASEGLAHREGLVTESEDSGFEMDSEDSNEESDSDAADVVAVSRSLASHICRDGDVTTRFRSALSSMRASVDRAEVQPHVDRAEVQPHTRRSLLEMTVLSAPPALPVSTNDWGRVLPPLPPFAEAVVDGARSNSLLEATRPSGYSAPCYAHTMSRCAQSWSYLPLSSSRDEQCRSSLGTNLCCDVSPSISEVLSPSLSPVSFCATRNTPWTSPASTSDSALTPKLCEGSQDTKAPLPDATMALLSLQQQQYIPQRSIDGATTSRSNLNASAATFSTMSRRPVRRLRAWSENLGSLSSSSSMGLHRLTSATTTLPTLSSSHSSEADAWHWKNRSSA